MNKTVVWIIAIVVVAAVMFGGGYLVATQVGGSSSRSGQSANGMRGGPGGAFAQLTDAERQQLQNMTAEERQQFFKDKGIQLPQGFDSANGPGGGGGFRRGSQEASGTVASVSADKITVTLNNGGSATFYVDPTTVKAAVAGAKPDVVVGAKVLVYAQPEAQGVTAAKTIIVK
jgi:hypothetical protein